MAFLSNFLSREQEFESLRIKFYFSGFKVCPKCNSHQFSKVTTVNGNQNGKDFGSDCFTCLQSTCRWESNFKWDQNFVAYYFEAQTLGWKKPNTMAEDTVILRLIKRPYMYGNKPRAKELKATIIAVNSVDGSQVALTGKKRRANVSLDVNNELVTNSRVVRRSKTRNNNLSEDNNSRSDLHDIYRSLFGSSAPDELIKEALFEDSNAEFN